MIHEMKDTIIKKIDHWSETFNLPQNKDKFPFFPENDRQELSFNLIEEEFWELKEAIEEKDLEEVCDASGDLLWVVTRFMREHGIDPEKCINAIYESNMSKIDTNATDAKLTRDKYAREGIDTISSYDETSKCFITKRKEDDKILKSHKFKKPDFSKLFEKPSESGSYKEIEEDDWSNIREVIQNELKDRNVTVIIYNKG